MSKKNDIKKRVLFYLNSISKKIPIKKAILFGSYAHGKPSKYSDIDLAIFSPKFSDKTHLKDLKFLWTEAAKIDPQIEPLPFSTLELEKVNPRSFLAEILKSGKVIYHK
ncbi:MAG: nucleotidyltransferase domain-containing protein [Candidatus Margulisiibacteriota bacterium]